jgi:hypothetical protein
MRGDDSIHELLGWTCLLFPTKRTVFTFTPIKSSVPHAAASVAYQITEFSTKLFAQSHITSVFWVLVDHP